MNNDNDDKIVAFVYCFSISITIRLCYSQNVKINKPSAYIIDIHSGFF